MIDKNYSRTDFIFTTSALISFGVCFQNIAVNFYGTRKTLDNVKSSFWYFILLFTTA